MINDNIQALLVRNSYLFHPIVPYDPAKDKIIKLDLSSSNPELTQAIFSNTKTFSAWINEKLESAKARYGIGGYAEHREVYSSSIVFGTNPNDVEPRRLHLGIDIWGKANTGVMAPLDGLVHSFAFNNQPGDYGATIILTHNLEGHSFHTLYGHLSLNSIANLREGETIHAGDVIADFGIPAENGQWPPHLHFQIIIDIGDWKGDYPGVCRFSEKESWLLNSPDPQVILANEKWNM